MCHFASFFLPVVIDPSMTAASANASWFECA